MNYVNNLELKFYPHFDQYLPVEEINKILSNPERVTKNAFFPFLEYEDKWRSFSGKEKSRIIRYASRRDSYIFKHYRSFLLEKYEEKLFKYGIQDCPIAYRKIPISANSKLGKCNIHFAKEAFETISAFGPCYAIAIDIKGFFDSIHHEILKQRWCDLLGEQILPKDHFAIFKAITNYSVVNRHECLERLGYIKTIKINGRTITSLARKIPLQLCTPEVFREKIFCDNSDLSLIKRNKKNIGIPQGAPISDLLANIYMFNFDCALFELAKKLSGYYRRYSDDILFILPYSNDLNLQEIMGLIESFAVKEKLILNSEKTNITEFYFCNSKLQCRPCFLDGRGDIMSNRPFEYLGFSFNGKKVLIKDKTLSAYYREMIFMIRQEAKMLVTRYIGKTPDQIFSLADFSKLSQKVRKIDKSNDESCNFWSYAVRAKNIMGEMGRDILYQLRHGKKILKEKLQSEIRKAYKINQKISHL
ncbi:MAG: Reverse transcriptase (RNA-dependent polymerase) [Rickettsiaceae bacterium]|jgi:hypothetical protein|nr:Reverse transcriptase (RNA-dependent polymerase) [Rickettsiaceae bacterium]